MGTMNKARRSEQPTIGDIGGRRFSKARSLAERSIACPRTLFRWADAGLITRHKINARVVLFDEVEVVALLEGSRIG